MKKKCLAMLVMFAVLNVSGCRESLEKEPEQELKMEGETTMKIRVKSADYEIVYVLNNSQAARE